MMARFQIGFILLLVFLAGTTATADERLPDTLEQANIEAQRRVFLDALSAVRSGRIEKYRALSATLDGYVLLGNLEYEYLKRRVATTPVKTMQQYLHENRFNVTSQYLRQRWLHHLARQGQWDLFLQEYRDYPKAKRLYCYRLDRLLRSPGQDQAALMSEVARLWQTGKRLPSSCKPVFEQWRKAGHMTRDLVITRIRLAMQRRRLSLARELSYYLPVQDRKWVERWLRAHRNPSRELALINYRIDKPIARMMVKHGVVRLAYRDPEAAMERWQKLKQKHRFFGEDEDYVLRYVGILAAQRHLPQAVDWLSAVSAREDDRNLHYWRIRAAVRANDWETAREFVAALTQDELEEDEWRYWQARIAEETDDADAAWDAYADLARERSYYGFLAADKVGARYSMQHRAVDVGPRELRGMVSRPEMRIAQELFRIGQTVSARRQWFWAIQHMNKRELQVAAVAARNWGWYDRALYTVGKSGYLDDLDLRFPVLYRDKVERNSQRTGVDPGWIYGVMRQESAFVTDARSGAGALGLMQLMPRTGRATAKRLRLNIRSRRAILNVDNNLRLGSYYLKTMLRRNQGNQVLATAAYNAGSHRVKKWLPADRTMPADIWVDSIPFNETRNYVKNVMGFTAIYERRLDLAPTPLKVRMEAIGPRGSKRR